MRSIKDHRVTLLHYYALLLNVRSNSSTFHHCGEVTQQFIVDAYRKMEVDRLDRRLDRIRNNQKKLQIGFHTIWVESRAHDYIRDRPESEKDNIEEALFILLSNYLFM